MKLIYRINLSVLERWHTLALGRLHASFFHIIFAVLLNVMTIIIALTIVIDNQSIIFLVRGARKFWI